MAREQIAGYYRELLGREPDQAGLDSWTNAVNQGYLTLDGAAGMIARSGEARDQRQQRATPHCWANKQNVGRQAVSF